MFIDTSLSKVHGLVGAQFFLTLLAIIPFFGRPSPDTLGIAMLCAGLMFGAWTLKTNSPENFNVSPLPKIGARLCFDGPYRFCRHPMYLSLMLTVVGIVQCNQSLTNAVAAVLLALVLDFKARMEETLLQEESAEYRAYMERSWRFIPLIY
jgi:protein-S-isoprenylcysteine O-methyltransferase Ste14